MDNQKLKNRAYREITIMWVLIYLLLAFIYLSFNPFRWMWSGALAFFLFGAVTSFNELWKRFKN